MNDAEFLTADDNPLIYPDDVDFGFKEKEMDDPSDFFSNIFFPDINCK
jgi:hypothetical protein